MISVQVKLQILLTTVAGPSSMQLKLGRIENMVIETVLFVAFVIAAGAAIVKAFEWSQDVLYGPYIKRFD
jgi:hypothetical protein